MKRIYTIGHSTEPTECLINRLRQYQITCVVDVRSIPYSQFAHQYNGNFIKGILHEAQIVYLHMGKEFGARQDSERYYNAEGILDFEAYQKAPTFQKGFTRIENGIMKGYNIAFMCSEKDPIDCHRNIMVARYFFNHGYSIGNIMIDGTVQEQEEIEERLLDMYFPQRNELNLFEMLEGKKEKSQYLSEAYHLRNMEIGYHLGMEEKL